MGYSHQCTVFLNDVVDTSKADFVIDDVCFRDLPTKATDYTEANVSMELNASVSAYGHIVPRKINRAAPTGLMGGLMAFANGSNTTDSETAAAGLAVMRAAASEAAQAGVAAAVNAAVSGVEAINAAANEASPKIAEVSEKTTAKASRGLSEFFASCCLVNHVHVEDSVEVDGCVVLVEASHAEESVKPAIVADPKDMH